MEKTKSDIREVENREWQDSLKFLMKHEGADRVTEVLHLLQQTASSQGIETNGLAVPYSNSIPPEQEHNYPGDRELERQIEAAIRWNAMAMVVRANKQSSGIGGHISTYASAATLYEVAFNHFFRGDEGEEPADLVYFQGHAAPGIYARSFLEGRLSEEKLANFRREMQPEGGLSSYPHPRLMPNYWKFPTVSMGLSPLQAIYQARLIRYLENRELVEQTGQRVWAFLGDGEMDEPESAGALTVASREQLDNLIFVVNCNLQRLDGPVRGNHQVISELEKLYKGAGWKVIKVLWGSKWDDLLKKDRSGLLVKRMGEVVDGQYQRYTMAKGSFIREDFFGKYPELLELVEDYSDEEIENLNRGGHDPIKVYNAYKEATTDQRKPVVILAQTIKGYGLGESGEASNVTHQQKKLDEDALLYFRDRFEVPIPDEKAKKAAFYQLPKNSPALKYLKERREKLGGFLPHRADHTTLINGPENKVFESFFKGSGDKQVATTMVSVQLLSNLMKDKAIGSHIVPIVPDESRTFGMDALFRQVGIYSPIGQQYEPVDKKSLMYYREDKKGQILEEGITEAGSMSSFIAAGTAHINQGINLIPFYFFYSMFGFQRVGDFIWAAADARARGFLIGGTAGRTTLPGEGLQHQDGQSHLYALSVPNLRAYDPAFAYEVATIIKDGLERMYEKEEDIFYYLTVTNDTYQMPPMLEDSEEGILKGLYRFRKSKKRGKKKKAHLLGSGAVMMEVIEAADILEKDFGITTDVWSATSYKALYDNANHIDRQNRLNGDGRKEKNYIQQCFEKEEGVVVAASDYLKAVPLSVCQWFPKPFTALGTDGFGRSEARENLRYFFGVDAAHIALAALSALKDEGRIEEEEWKKAIKKMGIPQDKPTPMAMKN